ncbi:hypothetical protein [Geodermatophilus sabuli]|uniref:Uncharacterized protein n=1 Tax=Geodermatophilus sabuli TaxID=1564158 RepID=A0A285EA52_9ACTN|nr:hypothetical protein [Geodermatophilus sabuli]MBB3085714.1 hypothetical protein [Geodermatophilus sabuli]SNX95867.1 hypothetical protein SAMN06893097_10336 [Geodermatophilus sabuli]
MTDDLPPIERHQATDRFGKEALRAAHRLTEALAEVEDAAPEPVLFRRNGPHRSLDGLAALLDEALEEPDPGERSTGDREGRREP